MDTKQKIEAIAEKIKGMRTAMVVTMDEKGRHVGRPMATQDVEFDGSVWFMTAKDSSKVTDIKTNPSVALLYGDGSIKFVSLSGDAALIEDKQKIKEFWNPFYEAWFTGPEDPNIILIKVAISRAEFWDHAGGKVGAYVDMATSSLTGKTMSGENEVIEL